MLGLSSSRAYHEPSDLFRISGELEDTYRVEDHVVPKSDEERRSILQAIKSNFLFDHTTDQQRQVCRRNSSATCVFFTQALTAVLVHNGKI